MSKRSVWKYVLPQPTTTGRSFVDMPVEAVPLSVDLQGDHTVVWALIDPDRTPPEGETPTRQHEFILANTGAGIPGFPPSARFLGTVTTDSAIVWHVWDGDAEPTE